MKNLFYFFISFAAIIICHTSSFAQDRNDSLLQNRNDTNNHSAIKKSNDSNKKNNRSDTVRPFKRQSIAVKADTSKTNNYKDTLVENTAITDSAGNRARIDSTFAMQASIKGRHTIIHNLLLRNRYINIKDEPVYFIEEERHPSGKEFLFYSLCTIVLILGIFKAFYNGYFKNLFRVYFNTSLRQTQLADQLLQAKLPSFILNIFFAITTGIYIWLLFSYYHPPRLISSRLLLPFCIISVAMLYFIKYCLLKFMGWVSGTQPTIDNYIFAIFMVNKIIGIFLVPVIILLAFLIPEWVPVVSNISFMILGLFFLSRYIKSYGAIEKKIPLNPFHFIIYIIGAEIFPLIIIYKAATDYLI
ncbi:MAG: DUF4271 domain-containing protein [Ginsengibacter sp.]